MAQKNDFDKLMIKLIAKNQMKIDPQFVKEATTLRRKLILRKITGNKFWKAYKKSLTKSIRKNQITLKKLFKKIDKQLTKQFHLADKTQTKKTIIDLDLPQD